MPLRFPFAQPRWIALLTSAILALSLLPLRASADEANPAPAAAMYRGDAARTGVQPGPVPGSPPAVLWQFQARGAIRSSAAVVDGVAYFGSKDWNVYAIDVATGAERWRAATEGWVISSPAVFDGIVYVGSFDGYFYAFDSANGERLWRLHTRNARSATVIDGELYLATDEPAIRRLDAATGTERWHIAFDCEYVNEVAVAGQTVYVASSNQLLQAFDRETGRLRWFAKLDGQPTTSPVVNGGWVYVTVGVNGIEAPDASQTVAPDGSSQAGGQSTSGSTDETGDGGGAGVVPGPARVVAIDAETGEVRWSHDISINRAIRTPPAVADGTVVVGTDLGTVVGLDAMTGLERWGFQAAGAINGSPAIANGEVIVGDYAGAVHSLDLQTGAEQWWLDLGAPVFTSPAILDGVIYLGHDGGGLVAIGDSVEPAPSE